MEMIKVIEIPRIWNYKKHLEEITARKNLSDVLKNFRKFADTHPSYFKGIKPYIGGSTDREYHIYCFMHYYENRFLLEAGNRSIKFDAKQVRKTLLGENNDEYC